MRTEQEIKELAEELEKLTGFIAEHDPADQPYTKDFAFACSVCDALSWVLGEISTENFMDDNYINLSLLKRIAGAIQIKSGGL